VLVDVGDGVLEGVFDEVAVMVAVLEDDGVFGGVPEILAVAVEEAVCVGVAVLVAVIDAVAEDDHDGVKLTADPDPTLKEHVPPSVTYLVTPM
jgi:hypothetical protein